MTPRPIPQQTVKRTMQIDEISDDLTSMSVSYQEPIAEKPKRAKRKGRRVGNSYIMFDTKSMADLDLSRQEYRVLQTMVGLIDTKTGEIRATGKLIAARGGMAAANVSAGLKSLRERNIVIRIEYGAWRLNRWLCQAGEWSEWNAGAVTDGEPVWKVEEHSSV